MIPTRVLPKALALTVVAACTCSCSTIVFSGFGVQSHFGYPNSNVAALGRAEGVATHSQIFGRPERTDLLERAAIDSALTRFGPGHMLINYRIYERRSDILWWHKIAVVVRGYVVRIDEMGWQETWRRPPRHELQVPAVTTPATAAPIPPSSKPAGKQPQKGGKK